MKTKKRNIFGRNYTIFGHCLNVLLAVIGFASFTVLLVLTGICENGGMSVIEYLIKGAISLAVMGASILLHKQIFD